MPVAVRFAPSPTGRLHVGNIRLALINWLFARQQGGTVQLRLDDTDTERSEERFADAIRTDLRWLGLDWDREDRQSDRLARYAEAAEQLRRIERLYPCYETPEELGLKRKAALAQGRPPIYDRTALRTDATGRDKLEAQGRHPHWRFKLAQGAIVWNDLVRGPVRFEAADLSDPVLVREDGRPLYSLSSVVDDGDFGISHVIRGEDHVANTAVQVQLWQALEMPVPTFAHLPLLTDAGGQGLSKRLGSLSVASLRDDEGLEALAINSLLARLGTADPIEPVAHLNALVPGFSFDRISRSPAKFDREDLRRLNARVLHSLSHDAVTDRLATLDLQALDAHFWQAVRNNLERFSDVRSWWAVARAPVQPVIEDAALLTVAATLLPAEPWDDGTFGLWTDAVKAATGKKGKVLFRPIRLALTAQEHGPELKRLLPLIGRDRVVARLHGQTA